MQLNYVRLRVFCHATEDKEKVIQAILNLIPEEIHPKITFSKSSAKGHFGNEISIFETEITGKNRIKKIVNNLPEDLTPQEDNPAHPYFILKISKQDAFNNTICHAQIDPIYLKLGFSVWGKKTLSWRELVSFCK